MNLTTNQTKVIYTQTIHPPFDELGLVEAHHKLVFEHLRWSDVGILIDQHIGEQCTTLITLIENNRVVSVFRICLSSPEKTLAAIRLFTPDKSARIFFKPPEIGRGKNFTTGTKRNLLNGLSYDPVPALSITWPVQRASIAAPSNIQINQSMAKMNWRMNSVGLMSISDNDSMLKNFLPDQLHPFWPKVIEDTSAMIFSLIGRNQFRAALFAFGLMPQLIALGTKIGNKQEIIPMLRYRDGNQWTWPADVPQGKNYDISGLEHLEQNEDEIL